MATPNFLEFVDANTYIYICSVAPIYIYTYMCAFILYIYTCPITCFKVSLFQCKHVVPAAKHFESCFRKKVQVSEVWDFWEKVRRSRRFLSVWILMGKKLLQHNCSVLMNAWIIHNLRFHPVYCTVFFAVQYGTVHQTFLLMLKFDHRS